MIVALLILSTLPIRGPNVSSFGPGRLQLKPGQDGCLYDIPSGKFTFTKLYINKLKKRFGNATAKGEFLEWKRCKVHCVLQYQTPEDDPGNENQKKTPHRRKGRKIYYWRDYRCPWGPLILKKEEETEIIKAPSSFRIIKKMRSFMIPASLFPTFGFRKKLLSGNVRFFGCILKIGIGNM